MIATYRIDLPVTRDGQTVRLAIVGHVGDRRTDVHAVQLHGHHWHGVLTDREYGDAAVALGFAAVRAASTVLLACVAEPTNPIT